MEYIGICHRFGFVEIPEKIKCKIKRIMKNYTSTFIWRITSAHVIAYFFAGIFAVVFMNYKDHYASESLSLLMRPVDSPYVALGPGLQLFRGILIALILLPVRKFIFEKNGFLKLGFLLLGLSFLSTIGPTPGSFEGYIYTILPIQYHLLGIPETLIYIGLFIGILAFWYKKEKKYVNVVAVILIVLILFMSFMGYLKAVGLLNV